MRISDWSSDVCSSDLPNAMGGREVGGLASTLASHMDFAPESVDRVRRFWSAPAMAAKPGLKAVDMFREVGRGKIKALWIMATNPAVSLPNAGAVREALAACPFVVRSEEHTSELQSLMRISYAVFCLNNKNIHTKVKETQYTNKR